MRMKDFAMWVWGALSHGVLGERFGTVPNELSLRTLSVMNEMDGSGDVGGLTWTFSELSFSSSSSVQCLMEAHLAPTQPTQVNKITTSCEICSGPHDTQYYMEDPEQAFVEYASSRIDEAGGKWYTFKPEQNNLGDTYNPS
nr:MAK10-like protein [Tanacetum cinerariifolium]